MVTTVLPSSEDKDRDRVIEMQWKKREKNGIKKDVLEIEKIKCFRSKFKYHEANPDLDGFV